MKPELELEHEDRGQLAVLAGTEGFRVLQRIMRAEVDKFIVALINASASDDGDVLAKHKLAKAAAQFFQAVTDRVNGEIAVYAAAPKKGDKPVDLTAGVIDLGETSLDELPNLLGGR